MKSFRIIGTGFCSLLLLIVSSCEQAEITGLFQKELPKDRTLVDAAGRELKVTVIGRDLDSITFERRSDRARFNYRIDKLSDSDRDWANSLPITPVAATESSATAGSPVSRASSSQGETFDEKNLRELNEQIENLYLEIYELGGNSMKVKSMRSQLKRLKQERARLSERS